VPLPRRSGPVDRGVNVRTHLQQAGNGVAVMAAKQIVVIGGNFGGLTAALELKHELGVDVEVTVVSATDRFLFNPSLIWLPFGKRSADGITFPLEPVFGAHHIGFTHAEATAIDPAAQWRPPRAAIRDRIVPPWRRVISPRGTGLTRTGVSPRATR
jgi:hypothetical protein